MKGKKEREKKRGKKREGKKEREKKRGKKREGKKEREKKRRKKNAFNAFQKNKNALIHSDSINGRRRLWSKLVLFKLLKILSSSVNDYLGSPHSWII